MCIGVFVCYYVTHPCKLNTSVSLIYLVLFFYFLKFFRQNSAVNSSQFFNMAAIAKYRPARVHTRHETCLLIDNLWLPEDRMGNSLQHLAREIGVIDKFPSLYYFFSFMIHLFHLVF